MNLQVLLSLYDRCLNCRYDSASSKQPPAHFQLLKELAGCFLSENFPFCSSNAQEAATMQQWKEFDFYDAKNTVEEAFNLFGSKNERQEEVGCHVEQVSDIFEICFGAVHAIHRYTTIIRTSCLPQLKKLIDSIAAFTDGISLPSSDTSTSNSAAELGHVLEQSIAKLLMEATQREEEKKEATQQALQTLEIVLHQCFQRRTIGSADGDTKLAVEGVFGACVRTIQDELETLESNRAGSNLNAADLHLLCASHRLLMMEYQFFEELSSVSASYLADFLAISPSTKHCLSVPAAVLMFWLQNQQKLPEVLLGKQTERDQQSLITMDALMEKYILQGIDPSIVPLLTLHGSTDAPLSASSPVVIQLPLSSSNDDDDDDDVEELKQLVSLQTTLQKKGLRVPRLQLSGLECFSIPQDATNDFKTMIAIGCRCRATFHLTPLADKFCTLEQWMQTSPGENERQSVILSITRTLIDWIDCVDVTELCCARTGSPFVLRSPSSVILESTPFSTSKLNVALLLDMSRVEGEKVGCKRKRSSPPCTVRVHDQLVVNLAHFIQFIAIHQHPVLDRHALLAEAILGQDSRTTLTVRSVLKYLESLEVQCENEVSGTNQLLMDQSVVDGLGCQAVMEPRVIASSTPTPTRRTRRFGTPISDGHQRTPTPTVTTPRAMPRDNSSAFDEFLALVPNLNLPGCGSLYDELLNVLLSTDHCRKIIAPKSRFQISKVYQIQNEYLFHGYLGKRDQLKLVKSRKTIPLLINDQSGTKPSPRFHAYDYLTKELQQHLPQLFGGVETGVNDDKENNFVSQLNECWLLHGTTPEHAKAIARDGLDERVSNINGLFGTGIYFTNTICKSFTYSKPILTMEHPTATNAPTVPLAERVVLLCRVMLGDAFITDKSMKTTRRPPMKTDNGGVEVGGSSYYDSVIGNGKEHKEFVIYDRGMVYPQYIVHYHTAE